MLSFLQRDGVVLAKYSSCICALWELSYWLSGQATKYCWKFSHLGSHATHLKNGAREGSYPLPPSPYPSLLLRLENECALTLMCINYRMNVHNRMNVRII